MTKAQDLTHDIVLHYHNVHANNARIHERVTFLAQKRVVEYHSCCDRKQSLPFLPMKHSETTEYLEIPDGIVTESQLIDYIYQNKPFWLHGYHRQFQAPQPSPTTQIYTPKTQENTMKQADMMLLVPQKLKEIEKEYGIRILYAAESGSRAWGTNHAESDFDVRFIYIRPKAEYLRMQPHKDTLEFPISEGWDMCGWDLTKTLKLLHNANRQIFEWFGSPLVYMDDGFSQRFRPILDAYFSVKTALYHYLKQTDLNMKEQENAEPTKIKHYLYRFQHLAAARWVLEHRMPAPVSFRELTPWMPSDIRQAALDLLEQKTTHPEAPLMPHDPVLDQHLQEERKKLGLLADMLPKEPEKGWEMLDQFFLSELERL